METTYPSPPYPFFYPARQIHIFTITEETTAAFQPAGQLATRVITSLQLPENIPSVTKQEPPAKADARSNCPWRALQDEGFRLASRPIFILVSIILAICWIFVELDLEDPFALTLNT